MKLKNFTLSSLIFLESFFLLGCRENKPYLKSLTQDEISFKDNDAREMKAFARYLGEKQKIGIIDYDHYEIKLISSFENEDYKTFTIPDFIKKNYVGGVEFFAVDKDGYSSDTTKMLYPNFK